MFFRAIIADDEPLARGRIRSFLGDEKDMQIVAECANGAQTFKAIHEHRPDLLFLDVQMPRLDGFEVLQGLKPSEIPVVIFTTAHEGHAIQAFEVNALDYLLKPFTEARFKMAVQRARNQLRNRGGHRPDPNVVSLVNDLNAATSGSGRILVRSRERILFLKASDIDYVEAAGNYVVLHAGKESHILRETTASMEARLAPSGFMRVNRSAIVNLARIREVQTVGPGQHVILLMGGTRVDMSCRLSELQARLSHV